MLRRPDLPLLLHRSIHPAISRSEFILYESQSVAKTFWLGFRRIAFEKTGWLHGASALITPSASQHLAESQSDKASSEKGFHVNFVASGGIPVKKFQDSFAMKSVSHFLLDIHRGNPEAEMLALSNPQTNM